MSNSEIDATLAKLEKRIAKPVYSSDIEKKSKVKTADSRALANLAKSIRGIIRNNRDDAQPQHST